MTQDYIRLNIAFRPPIEVQNYAIQISQDIAKNHDPFFILDGKSTVEPARLYFAIKGVLQPESATPAGQ